MAKPRIIIADTDISYIVPLQLKFVEDFFEKVELEIITDEQYYDTLFSTPQRADILIVSEGLYSQTMQRHNISHIFVMNEQYEEDQTADLNVNHIFKYARARLPERRNNHHPMRYARGRGRRHIQARHLPLDRRS